MNRIQTHFSGCRRCNIAVIGLILSLFMICISDFFAQEKWVPNYSKRDEWQWPEKIMDALGIKSGMVIADVGAGKGYFTFKLAERVGPDGKVYATDIEESPLKEIRDRAKNEGFENIATILGKLDNPNLPQGQLDILLMVHVFHIIIHEQDPFPFLENIRPSLKPNGLVALVQWEGKKMGYPDVYAYSQESVFEVIEDSSFELVRIETFLPRETIIILRAK